MLERVSREGERRVRSCRRDRWEMGGRLGRTSEAAREDGTYAILEVWEGKMGCFE